MFAPGAAIIEYTDKGPRRLAPPQDHYFRGSVIGDLDSVVVLVSGAKLRGFVYTKGQLYAIAPDRDVYADDLPDPAARLRRVDPERDRPAGMPPFHCDVESVPAPLGEGMSATAFGGADLGAADVDLDGVHREPRDRDGLRAVHEVRVFHGCRASVHRRPDGRGVGDLLAGRQDGLQDRHRAPVVHVSRPLDGDLDLHGPFGDAELLELELHLGPAHHRPHAEREEHGRRHRLRRGAVQLELRLRPEQQPRHHVQRDQPEPVLGRPLLHARDRPQLQLAAHRVLRPAGGHLHALRQLLVHRVGARRGAGRS